MIGVFAEMLAVAPELAAGITHLPAASALYPVAALLFRNRQAAFCVQAPFHLIDAQEILEIIANVCSLLEREKWMDTFLKAFSLMC